MFVFYSRICSATCLQDHIQVFGNQEKTWGVPQMVDPEKLVGLFHGTSHSINGWLKGNPICIAHGSKIYPVPGKHLILGEGGSKHVETHPVANITLIPIPLFWCKTESTVLMGFDRSKLYVPNWLGFDHWFPYYVSICMDNFSSPGSCEQAIFSRWNDGSFNADCPSMGQHP